MLNVNRFQILVPPLVITNQSFLNVSMYHSLFQAQIRSRKLRQTTLLPSSKTYTDLELLLGLEKACNAIPWTESPFVDNKIRPRFIPCHQIRRKMSSNVSSSSEQTSTPNSFNCALTTDLSTLYSLRYPVLQYLLQCILAIA